MHFCAEFRRNKAKEDPKWFQNVKETDDAYKALSDEDKAPCVTLQNNDEERYEVRPSQERRLERSESKSIIPPSYITNNLPLFASLLAEGNDKFTPPEEFETKGTTKSMPSDYSKRPPSKISYSTLITVSSRRRLG